jgi:hypothetical protein
MLFEGIDVTGNSVTEDESSFLEASFHKLYIIWYKRNPESTFGCTMNRLTYISRENRPNLSGGTLSRETNL